MQSAHIRFEMLHPKAVLPELATAESTGFDAVAVEDVMLAPGAVALVPLGFRTEFSPCIDAQIRSRSGLAYKYRVAVLNSPGTIDPDYRGEWKVLLMNHGVAPYQVYAGDRVAQIVFAPNYYPERILLTESEVDESSRSAGGFGSTGS